MKSEPTPIQCRDTALALTFLLLLIWFFSRNAVFVYLAMAVLLVGMTVPSLLAWPARAWFGLSHLLSLVVSKIVLGVLFFVIVLPVALVRKAMGKDPMRLKQWRDGKPSAFVVREHLFVGEDLDNPF